MDVASEVTLNAECKTTPEDLRVRFSLRNNLGEDIYVLTALPKLNPETRQAIADAGAYSLFLSKPAEATVLIGVPPLPSRKLVAVRVMPLAVKLPAGGTLSHTVSPIPLPLAERSVYESAPPGSLLRRVQIERLALRVQYIKSSTPDLEVTPVSYSAEHFNVRTKKTVADIREVQANLLTKEMSLRMFTRDD